MKHWQIPCVLLLCIFLGSGWLLTQFYPGEIVFPASAGIHFFVVALVATMVWLCTGRKKLKPWHGVTVAVAGIAIFAVPSILLQLSSSTVSAFFSIALFCAIPSLTALLLGAWSRNGSGAISSRALIAGVVGLGGALQLFPSNFPFSAKGWAFSIALLIACVAVAGASILLHQLLSEVPFAAVVAIISFASAAALTSYAAFIGLPALSFRLIGMECLRCLIFDLPVVWLTLWLIREIAPQRLSSRFLLAPLVTVLEGYVEMRGVIDVKSAIAMVLMAGAGVALLLENEQEEVPSLHLR